MANDLDRFFREGLDQFEVAPQAQSWEQVQKQLTRKKKSGWMLPYGIAAAVLALLAATIVALNFSENRAFADRGIATALIDHPAAPEIITIRVEAFQDKPAPQPQSAVAQQRHLPASTQEPENPSQPRAAEEEMNRPEFTTLTVAGIGPAPLEERLSDTRTLSATAVRNEPHATVTIIHIAGNSDENNRNGRIGNIITAFSKDVSASDILADLRDAKDNLFRKN